MSVAALRTNGAVIKLFIDLSGISDESQRRQRRMGGLLQRLPIGAVIKLHFHRYYDVNMHKRHSAEDKCNEY